MTPLPPPAGRHALALFDLDHTLIPFDSGQAWTQFLVARGVLETDAEARYLDFCHQYVAGTLDIHAMHRANWAALRQHPRAVLAQWQREFEQAIAPRVGAAAHALVRKHRDAGHRCAIVTATTDPIAQAFARVFDVDAVIATRAASLDGSAQSPLTGEIDGVPCYREGKLTRVNEWLATQPAVPSSLSSFDESWFYSDSMSDLPLLAAVTHPVAVNPDERLRRHALAAGWPVIALA